MKNGLHEHWVNLKPLADIAYYIPARRGSGKGIIVVETGGAATVLAQEMWQNANILHQMQIFCIEGS